LSSGFSDHSASRRFGDAVQALEYRPCSFGDDGRFSTYLIGLRMIASSSCLLAFAKTFRFGFRFSFDTCPSAMVTAIPQAAIDFGFGLPVNLRSHQNL
jgi:hypothetical protein